MATLSELANSGSLERIEVDLEDELPWRCLFGTPAFVAWLDQVLPTLETGIIQAGTTPAQQVDALFFDIITGQPFSTDRRFKPMNYTPELHVWEFKTPDIRIIGWFPKIDHFVCCFGEHKDVLTRTPGLADRLTAQTSFVRQQLDLNEPKTVEFKDYSNVLSDKD